MLRQEKSLCVCQQKLAAKKRRIKCWIILENQILGRQTFEGLSLRDLCYGYGEETSLASIVVEELKRQGKTITAAESLTAGLFQARVADFSGASSIF